MNDLEIAAEEATAKGLVSSVVAEGLATASGGIRSTFPQLTLGAAGLASPFVVSEYGGIQVASIIDAAASAARIYTTFTQHSSSLFGQQATFTRREEDWRFQAELAVADLEALEKRVVEAEVRLAVAEHELALAQVQHQQAKEVGDVLREKFTNRELYDWMVGRLSSLYFSAYNLAVDVARKAQRCFQFELGEPTASFIKYGHWDNRREGLLAGQRLMSELRKMEVAYQEKNRREYELTKRVSLREIAPEELVGLRTSGTCRISLAESLFDVDHPSHIMRRIKSVAVTVPSVTGPFDSIGGTLTYLRGSLRVTASTDSSALVGDLFGSSESIAISSGQDDAGLFETRLQDERYLPFEGKGLVDSAWTLSLPSIYRSFDYNSISDVVLTVRYTAREGGLSPFGTEVQNNLKSAAGTAGFKHLVSLRAMFPEAFAALMVPGETRTVQVTLDESVFPQTPFDGTVAAAAAEAYLVAGVPMTASTIPVEIAFYPTGGTVAAGNWGVVPDGDGRTAKAVLATSGQLGSWTIAITNGVQDLGAPYTDLLLAIDYTVQPS